MKTGPLFRVCAADEWKAASASGAYHGSALDRRDGFLHLSTGGQLAETLAVHFTDHEGLVLLRIDPARLPDALHWEASRGGQAFPHLYAPLPASAVDAVVTLPDEPGARARFVSMAIKDR